ncbi:Septum site-determining protein MinD [Phycisphaerae bacterium RAS1]|nr:Septum site-determining protein MinD [Phycisphaerae bacterium RAS1]
MAIQLRISLFSHTGSVEPAVEAAFRAISEVRVVEACSGWEQLQTQLQADSVDAVAVDLDQDDAKFGLHIVQRIAEVCPDCAIIGLSASTDPNVIIAAMRAGCGQFVRIPIDDADLRTAIERIRRSRSPAEMGGRRICVLGSSGGAGATTVACNLAIELAGLLHRRTALVDMNLAFGDVACAFDCTPKYTLADVCRSDLEIDKTLLDGALHELPCNVSILARPNEMDLSVSAVAPDRVEHMFDALAAMFPFVVADLPRAFTPTTMAALSRADRVLIVTQLAVPFIRNAVRAYEFLLHAGADEERVEIVLNRRNASHDRIKPEEIESHFGRPLFAVIPNDYKRITASRDLGHPMMTDAPNSPARLAIHEMARVLASDMLGAPIEQEATGGLFGMFKKKKARARAGVVS